MAVFVGVDWGCSAHAVCVIDAKGMTLDRFEVGHDRAGLAALFTRLHQYAVHGIVPVAIERPSGLLVDALVEAGFVVTPIHPNVVKACRPRYRAVAAKSDPGDTYHPGRHPAHRRPSPAPARASVRRHQGVARPGPRPRRPGRRARGFGEPADRCAGGLLARRRPNLRRRRQPDRARLPRALSERPKRPPASAPSAWPASSPSIDTAAAARPRRCSNVCAAPPKAVPAKPKAKPRETSCAPWRAPCKPWSPSSPGSPAASSTRSPTCPTAAWSCPSRALAGLTPPRFSPNSVMCAHVSRPRINLPPRPASALSPMFPE